jgi:hypothetical protein
MTHYTTISSNLKRGILRFSENISHGLSRPELKFISQIIYGMLAAQSCHLSKIARALGENISLKKTIDRLSRNLGVFKGRDKLLDNAVDKYKGCLASATVLLIDGGDITKPCSPKMEYIDRVRDGSTGELADGYWTLSVTALTPERKMPIGIFSTVYSASEPDFVSEDDEVLKALDFTRKHFDKKCIKAFDRGYDAKIYYENLIKHKDNFIIRAKKNRNVIFNGETLNILELASRYKGKYKLPFRKKNGVKVDCKVSIVPVKLPCKPNKELNLVICNGLGKTPLMLITSLRSNDTRLAVAITKVYLMRWRIEEFYAFKKQQFGLENLRVRSLNSIRNLDLLLTIAMGYLGYMSAKGDKQKIVMELIHISKRIYGPPKFFFYAIADGMFTVFARAKPGFSYLLRKSPKDMQLSLWEPPRICAA